MTWKQRHHYTIEIRNCSLIHSTSFCCFSSEFMPDLHLDLPTAMTLLRHSKHRGAGLEHLNETLSVASELGFPHFEGREGPTYRQKKTFPLIKDGLAMIPACEYVQQSNVGTR